MNSVDGDDEASQGRGTEHYPVIDSAELEPVPRRRFRRPRRVIHELPRQPPGSVLVFQHPGHHEMAPAGPLRLDAEVVVNAVAVAVVSTRHTLIGASTALPTGEPWSCAMIRARFHCWITDALLAIESGCWDIRPFLADHLLSDRALRLLTARFTETADRYAFQRLALSRIIAYHELHPIVVPGLDARLVDVTVEIQPLRPDAGDQRWEPVPPSGNPGGTAGGLDATPPSDGDPQFVPDNYTWGDDAH